MYHHQVNVHLRHLPISQDQVFLEPANRVLNLTPTRRVVKVGRASKTRVKGLLAATDNAWFDSPVMSRNHAEIIYNPSKKDIRIRDVGSMHGTFVNGEKLGDAFRSLHLNDKIVFGVGVRRGSDLFPACHFDFAYEVLPWKRNSYTVPESSSDEDEGYHYSDEDEFARTSTQNDTSIDMMEMCHSSPKTSRSIDAIDLTVYDTPSPRLEPAKLSSVSMAKKTDQQESTPKSPVPGPGPSIDVSMHRRAVEVDYGCTKIQAPYPNYVYDESEGDEEKYLTSSPYDSDASDNDHNNDEDSDDSNHSEAPNASEGSADSILATGSPFPLSEVPGSAFISAHTSRESSSLPSVINSHPPLDNTDIPESHVRTQISISKEVMVAGGGEKDVEDYDDASVGLSEAAHEGLQILLKDGLRENKPANPSLPPSGPISSDIWSDRFLSFQRYEPSQPTPVDSTSRTSSWRLNRETSPSAVAMVKAPGSCNMVENSIDQSMDLDAPWNSSSKRKSCAKELGDMTGKHAFFEAREDNKAKLQAHIDEVKLNENERRLNPPQPSFTRLGRSVRFAQARAPFVQPTKYHGNGFDHGFGGNDHISEESKTKNQTASSPPYLIGSREERPFIHPYYFSSDASSRAPESPVLERHPARSGLRIDDIIDGSATAKSSKRKADEISEENNLSNRASDIKDDAECRVSMYDQDFASSVQAYLKSIKLPATVSEVPHQSSTIAVVPMLATANDEARPVKRLKMKKLAEAVGYFALGGAAVGAGLFSALVATAPDFL